MYSYWLFCTKLNWIQLSESQWRKSNCRFCHNYNSYSFHIHKILSILNVLSIYVNDRKFVRKNVHRNHKSFHKNVKIMVNVKKSQHLGKFYFWRSVLFCEKSFEKWHNLFAKIFALRNEHVASSGLTKLNLNTPLTPPHPHPENHKSPPPLQMYIKRWGNHHLLARCQS